LLLQLAARARWISFHRMNPAIGRACSCCYYCLSFRRQFVNLVTTCNRLSGNVIRTKACPIPFRFVFSFGIDPSITKMNGPSLRPRSGSAAQSHLRCRIPEMDYENALWGSTDRLREQYPLGPEPTCETSLLEFPSVIFVRLNQCRTCECNPSDDSETKLSENDCSRGLYRIVLLSAMRLRIIG